MSFWDAANSLQPATAAFLGIALIVAFGFEFINGFHDTANAVTTVIYTRTLRPTPAVVYSGVMNFLGVLFAPCCRPPQRGKPTNITGHASRVFAGRLLQDEPEDQLPGKSCGDRQPIRCRSPRPDAVDTWTA